MRLFLSILIIFGGNVREFQAWKKQTTLRYLDDRLLCLQKCREYLASLAVFYRWLFSEGIYTTEY